MTATRFSLEEAKLSLYELIMTQMLIKQIQIPQSQHSFNYKNCICIPALQLGYALVVSIDISIYITLFDCRTFKWFDKYLEVQDLSSSHVTGYYMGYNTFIVISDHGDKCIIIIRVIENDITIERLGIDYEQKNLLSYQEKAGDVIILYNNLNNNTSYNRIQLNPETQQFNIHAHEIPSIIPDFHTVYTTYNIESDKILIFSEIGLHIYNTTTQRFHLLVDTNEKSFATQPDFQYGFIYPYPKRTNTHIIFGAFKNAPYSHSNAIYCPYKIRLDSDHIIMLSSLSPKTECSGFFSPIPHCFAYFLGSHILQISVFQEPLKPPPPLATISSADKNTVIITLPFIEGWYIVDRLTLKVELSNETVSYKDIESLTDQTIKLKIADPGIHKIYIRVANRFGFIDSAPTSFTIEYYHHITNLSVKDDSECCMITWKPPNQVEGYIIEGSTSKVEGFTELLMINEPTSVGVVAKIPEEFRYIRMKTFYNGEFYISDPVVRKEETMRYIFSKTQKATLESYYEENRFPSKQDKYKIAEEVNAPMLCVARWFQNKRQSEKGQRDQAISLETAIYSNLPDLLQRNEEI